MQNSPRGYKPKFTVLYYRTTPGRHKWLKLGQFSHTEVWTTRLVVNAHRIMSYKPRDLTRHPWAQAWSTLLHFSALLTSVCRRSNHSWALQPQTKKNKCLQKFDICKPTYPKANISSSSSPFSQTFDIVLSTRKTNIRDKN